MRCIKIKIGFKHELKVWLVYFTTVICSAYIHEIGHCIPAWTHGFRAIPTPAKEYILDTIPLILKQYVSLGGIIGTVLFLFVILLLFIFNTYRYNSAILAGAMAIPGLYTLLFILNGRGHDGTEFQEAQSALGLSYAGHSLDWFFLILFICGVVVWAIKSRPSYKIIGRLLIGFVFTFVFLVGLQGINNAIFDTVFQSK